MYDLQRLTFPRCIKPPGAVGNPVVIIFSDASGQAYGACAYIRYQSADGSFEARLLMSKSKLAPIKKLSIVRLELCAALISSHEGL